MAYIWEQDEKDLEKIKKQNNKYIWEQERKTTPLVNKVKPKSHLGQAVETVFDTTVGAASRIGLGAIGLTEQITDFTQNRLADITGAVGLDKISDKYRRAAADDLTGYLRKENEKVYDRNIIKKDSFGAKVTEGVGQYGAMIITGGALGGLAKVPLGKAVPLSKAARATKVGAAIKNFSAPTTAIIAGMGGAETEARAEGKKGAGLAVYTAGSGLISGVVEGIGGLFGTSGLDKAIADKASQKLTSNAAKWLVDYTSKTVTEGLEEPLEGFLQTQLKKVSVDPNATYTVKEAFDDFLVGATIGGILQGGQVYNDIKSGNIYQTDAEIKSGKPLEKQVQELEQVKEIAKNPAEKEIIQAEIDSLIENDLVAKEQIKEKTEKQEIKQVEKVDKVDKIDKVEVEKEVEVKNKETEIQQIDNKGKEVSEEIVAELKDSKVKNKEGNLLEVYHGTQNKFGTFEKFSYNKKNQTGEDFGEAYYFTSDFDNAVGYAYDLYKDPKYQKYNKQYKELIKQFGESDADNKQKILKKISELKIDGQEIKEYASQKNAFITEGSEVKESYLDIKNPFIVDAKGENFRKVYKKYFDEAKQNGNDGIIVKNVEDFAIPSGNEKNITDTYIVFNKDQIIQSDINVEPKQETKIQQIDNKGKEVPKEKTKPLEELKQEPKVAKILKEKPKIPTKPKVEVEKEVVKLPTKQEIKEQKKAEKKAEEVKKVKKIVEKVKKEGKFSPEDVDIVKRNPELVEDFVAIRTTKAGNKIPAIRKSGVYAPKEFETSKFKDLKGLAGNKSHNFLSAAGAFDNKTTTEIAKTGMGAMKKVQYDVDSRIAESARYKSDITLRLNELVEKNNIKINKNTGQELFEALEGRKASPEITKFAKEVRKELDNMRIEANKVRKSLGKPEIGYIENYAPHLQKLTLYQKLIGNKDVEISENFDFIIPNEITNSRAKRRLDAEFNKETNAWKLLDGYVASISNDMFVSPSIEQVKAVNSVIMTDYPAMGNLLQNNIIKEQLVGQTAKIDSFFGVGEGTVKKAVLTKYTRARNTMALGGNLAWSVITQPLSIGNTVSRAGGITHGVQNTIKGIVGYVGNSSMKSKVNNLPSMIIKTDGASIGKTIGGDTDIVAMKLSKTKIDKFNDFLAFFPDKLEGFLTGISASAGYYEGQRLGLKGKDLDMFADMMAQNTQSMYNKEARPVVMNNLTVRTVAPFQTFAFEQYRYAKQLAGKGGGIPLTKAQRLSQSMMLILSMAMMNKLREEVTSSKVNTPGTFIPIFGSLVDEGIDKASQTIGIKDREFTGQGRVPLAPAEDIKTAWKAIDAVVQHDNWNPMRKEMVKWTMGFSGVSGASTVNRFVDGMIANSRGYQATTSGKVAFPVEGTEETMRAVIFGTYSTKEGQRYIKEGFSPMSEKQFEKAEAKVKRGESTLTEEFDKLYEEREEKRNQDKFKDFLSKNKNETDIKKVLGNEFDGEIKVSRNYAKAGDYELYKSKDGWKKLSDAQIEKHEKLDEIGFDYSDYYEQREKLNAINRKDIESLDKKKSIIDEIISSDLKEKEKIYMYGNYYSNEDKLKAFEKTGVDFDLYLNLQKKTAGLSAIDDPNSNIEGKTLSGSKKTQYIKELQSLKTTRTNKLVLMAFDYSLDNKEKTEVFNYINKLKLTADDKKEILKEMSSFTFYENGKLKGW